MYNTAKYYWFMEVYLCVTFHKLISLYLETIFIVKVQAMRVEFHGNIIKKEVMTSK